MLRRAFFFGAGLFFLGVIAGFSYQGFIYTPLSGQDVSEDDSEPSRASLYSELVKESEVFDHQKKVIGLIDELVGPSVVHIEAEKNGFGNRSVGSVEEAGSGVIVEFPGRKGEYFVLTNTHVIQNANRRKIKVELRDGRQITPVRVLTDPASDVAVMQITGSNLQAAKIGNSDNVTIGESVLAMGSPFGLSRSVTLGIISAKGRRDLELGNSSVRFQDFMQTDAAINPGNSGGPLISMKGEVIGINAAIASNSGGNEGIGFTIPVNMVVTIAKQLIDHGKAQRAFLGVTLNPDYGPADAIRLGLRTPIGAHITAIRPNTPASRASLQANDIILKYGSDIVEDDSHLINIVSLTPIGKEIPVIVWREGKQVQLSVTVGDRERLE